MWPAHPVRRPDLDGAFEAVKTKFPAARIDHMDQYTWPAIGTRVLPEKLFTDADLDKAISKAIEWLEFKAPSHIFYRSVFTRGGKYEVYFAAYAGPGDARTPR